MGIAPRLRLTYNLARPFSARVTAFLVISYLLGLAGLLVFNFIFQAKRPICAAAAQPNYDKDYCEPTPLEFYQQYYTRPQIEGEIGTIGTFPWTTNGFGNNTNVGPVDYSILTLNWTAEALQCTQYEASFTYHLPTESSTVSACWYCGPNLRVLCTVVDSERSTIPVSALIAYQPILSQFEELGVLARTVVTSALAGATVLAVRLDRHNTVAGLAPGILPFNDTVMRVALGTTLGYLPLTESSDAALAQIRTSSFAISDFLETVMSQDLQPDQRTTTNLRTLNVNYLCKSCRNEYKSAVEIFAILIGSTFGVLGTAFFFLKLAAEAIATKDDEDAHDFDAISATGGKYGSGPQTPGIQMLPQTGYPNYNRASTGTP